MNLDEKISALKALLKGYGRATVAFSGGVDSSFLSKMCRDVLGEGALAVTVDTVFIPRAEMEDARNMATRIGIRHRIIQVAKMEGGILKNPENRCYLCKREVFARIWEVARAEGMDCLLDGSNLDDLDDYRPGIKALEELDVKSPMVEVGLTKQEIREASKGLDLPTWNKPALACLASRIPYGEEITPKNLQMVEAAEEYLRQQGIKQLRVRCHKDLARIEVAPEEREKFFDLEFMDDLSAQLTAMGFRYVTLDTEGYKMGKLNQPRNGNRT